ncbi:cytochrome P450 [Streptomyces sp. GMY02]|uniref:cytochrome P450 family protein n=1 Tax=Streptomyces sp. GMY02 TaxID=1333528 RepID=UPI001C2BC22D|nr:cytochrome P450 [Streptomyces sp. GMY02]QXE35510.1 cytochrome P450 [Streptomyces sp. GMY02]
MEQQPFILDATGGNIHAEADQLRSLGPAVRVILPGGIPSWYITSHALLKALLTNDQVSKDPNQHWPAWMNGEHRDTWLRNWVGVTNMFTAYGPDHRRLRKLVAPAFTARRTAGMASRVEGITRTLLDAMADTPRGGTVDLRAAYAHPLPMRVICELFGLPEESRDSMARFIERIMDTTITSEEALAVQAEVRAILADLVAGKRAEPGEDMTSVLVASRDEDGSHLSEDELLDTLLLIIGAGHETTVNLIGNAVHALLTHPEQLRLVRTGAASWSDVIEETLRWAPSIASLPMRYAVNDIHVSGGPTIRAGDAILATYAAAGRDAAQYGSSAGEFDITRPALDHLAFGYGVHHCLGAPLARLEAGTALPVLFDRYPELALAAPPHGLEPVGSFIADGMRTLPVRLRPGSSPA